MGASPGPSQDELDEVIRRALRVVRPRTLYLVRHGQTAYNAGGRLRGLDDPPLDDVGMAEAAACGRWFASRSLDALYASPLARAVQTAGPVAAASGEPIATDERFRDRDYGPWTGQVKAEVERQFGTLDAAPGVEARIGLVRRLADGLRSVVSADHERLAIVSHDICIRVILGAILGRDAEEVPQRTGACNELALDGAGVTPVVVDELPR